MFQNVLVGVDGRQGGRDAIALAMRLLDRDARLTLVNVHSGRLHPSSVLDPTLARDEREISLELLEHERDDAEVTAELVGVEALSAGGGLHLQAERLGADLLVVGSCSHGALGRAMLGDDTRAALNGAPCAVAIAPRGYAQQPVPLARIGVAYNGSPESELALQTARRLASESNASIHALEVVTIPSYAYSGAITPVAGESIELMLREASDAMRLLPGVEGRAVYGLPGEELASFGDQLDLLVVGSRSYGPVKRLVLGSTSDYLERHARCALLVLPRTARSAQPSEHAHAAAAASGS